MTEPYAVLFAGLLIRISELDSGTVSIDVHDARAMELGISLEDAKLGGYEVDPQERMTDKQILRINPYTFYPEEEH